MAHSGNLTYKKAEVAKVVEQDTVISYSALFCSFSIFIRCVSVGMRARYFFPPNSSLMNNCVEAQPKMIILGHIYRNLHMLVQKLQGLEIRAEVFTYMKQSSK